MKQAFLSKPLSRNGARFIGKRPLCALCLLTILAGLAGTVLPLRTLPWLIVACVLGAVLVILAVKLHTIHFYTGCMAVCVLITIPIGVGASASYYDRIVRRLEADTGTLRSVEGMILERKWSTSYESAFVLRTERIDDEAINTKLLLQFPYPAECQPGDRIAVNGCLTSHEIESGGFAERRYYLAKGIPISVVIDENTYPHILAENCFSVSVVAAQISTLISAKLQYIVGEEAGSFLSALLLGRREDLAPNVIRDFRRLGLSHLLALSGLHLTLLTGAVGWLLERLHVGRMLRTLLQLVFVFGFVILTGAPTSVLRAALMLTFAVIARAIFADADTMTTLWCAAASICVVSPAAYFDLGLWMSVFATLGMVICQDFRFARLPRITRGPARAAIATLSANLLTVPFVALANGELSLVAILSNLIFVPVTSLLLYATPFVLLTSVISGPVSAFTKFILLLAARIARGRGLTIALQQTGMYWLLLPLLISFACLLLHPPKRKRIGLIALLLSTFCFFGGVLWLREQNSDEMIYLHKSKSEALIVQTDNGAVICDLGDGSYSPLRDAVSYAAVGGATEIDTLMLTHYHTRHIGSVLRVSEQTVLRRLLLPTPESAREREIAADIADNLRDAEIEIVFYPDGLPIAFGDVTLTPHTRAKLSRSAQPLLLFSVTQNGKRLTYFGQSVGESELRQIAEAYIAESDALILGAHGPIPKLAYTLPSLPETKQIVAADEEVLYILSPGHVEAIPTVTAERIRLRLGELAAETD